MKTRNDKWFTQIDIKNILDNHTKFTGKWSVLFEKRSSAVEHYIYYSIPIRKSVTDDVIKDINWGGDDEFTKKKVLYHNGKQFLSVSFRRYYNLLLFGNEYRQMYDKKVFAFIEKDDVFGTRSEKCQILTDELSTYLQDTKQDMLFGIRSHRYSERYLNEFGLRKSETEHISNRKNYIYNIQRNTQHEKDERFRAKSMTIVFGKYIITS